MAKKILVIHPTGNQNSKSVARGLADSDNLFAFITALNINSKRWSFFPEKLVGEIKRRDFSEIKSLIVSGAPFRETVRLLASKLKLGLLTKHEVGFASVDNVYHATDHYAAKYLEKHAAEVSAVYCYEDGALETFRVAKRLGIKCFYELPTGYWRMLHKLNQEENHLKPEWAFSWIAIKDSEKKLARKDEELSLADTVVVASTFTKSSLSEYPNELKSIEVIPYGFPRVLSDSKKPWFDGSRKLKVLFVGGLKQGKGLSYLVDAVNALEDKVDFSFIGGGVALDLVRDSLPDASYLGTMPHSQVLEVMRNHDVLIFPSLFEGFGMVITEAMSQGMVVIATNHTAASDIVNENSGIIVPVRDPIAIIDAFNDLINNPEKVEKIGKSAMKAAHSYQWHEYESRIVEILTR